MVKKPLFYHSFCMLFNFRPEKRKTMVQKPPPKNPDFKEKMRLSIFENRCFPAVLSSFEGFQRNRATSARFCWPPGVHRNVLDVFLAELVACGSMCGRFSCFLAIFDRFQHISATFQHFFKGFWPKTALKTFTYQTGLLSDTITHKYIETMY